VFDQSVSKNYGEVARRVCVDLLEFLAAAVEFEYAASLAVGYDKLVH
jgi:hypothetical protein